MKRMLLAVCLSLVAAQAQAISRYTSTSMACADVQATIRNDGEAIMRYRSPRNKSLQLYGRYVESRFYCKIDESALTKFIPSADDETCAVRECIDVDPGDRFIIIPRR